MALDHARHMASLRAGPTTDGGISDARQRSRTHDRVIILDTSFSVDNFATLARRRRRRSRTGNVEDGAISKRRCAARRTMAEGHERGNVD
jgi:hypothetical protein